MTAKRPERPCVGAVTVPHDSRRDGTFLEAHETLQHRQHRRFRDLVRLAPRIDAVRLGLVMRGLGHGLGWSVARLRGAGVGMMRGAAEAFGVALQAIGGALVDAATAPDAQEEMRREIDALRAELREADAQAEALRDELSTTNVRLEGIISDRDRAFLDISREYQLRKQVVADLEAMRATLTQRERELADYDVALGKAQQELQECRQELNSEKRHATSVFAQLGNADAELETTRGACDSLAIGLAEKQDELESMQRQRDAFAHDLTAVVQREVEAQNRAFKAGWEDADECIRRENWIVPRTAEVVRVSASYVAYQQDEWDDFPAVEYAQFVRLPEPPEVSHG